VGRPMWRGRDFPCIENDPHDFQPRNDVKHLVCAYVLSPLL
jgi:hypothetical protein